jgi:hypothetical protein
MPESTASTSTGVAAAGAPEEVGDVGALADGEGSDGGADGELLTFPTAPSAALKILDMMEPKMLILDPDLLEEAQRSRV